MVLRFTNTSPSIYAITQLTNNGTNAYRRLSAMPVKKRLSTRSITQIQSHSITFLLGLIWSVQASNQLVLLGLPSFSEFYWVASWYYAYLTFTGGNY